MTRQTAKITILGPVVPDFNPDRSVKGHRFTFLQAGSQPIVLNYASVREATKARREIIQLDNVYSVPNEHLFDGIVKAMHEAYELGAEPETEI